MSLRVARNGEDREMDVVADGPHVVPSRLNAAEMTASLLRAIDRDPNPQGRWKGAISSEDGTALLIDIPDGDGVRTFVLFVREV